MTDSFKQEKERILFLVSSKKEKLREAAKKPMNIRLKDKLAFTFGISNITFAAFFLGYWTQKFYWWYSIQIPLLVIIRYFLYHKQKKHYFLLDFCYFVNLLFFLYLHFFPQSCLLFKISFSFVSGPLLFAILAWRNSTVFHSMDKITSLFIHLTPALVVWSIRWFPTGEFNTCFNDGKSYVSFIDTTLVPLIPYSIWQKKFLYFIKVQLMDKYKFLIDPEYMTSFKWLLNSKKSFSYKVVNMFGPQYRLLMYGILQLIYTVLTTLPVLICYQNFWLHTFYISVMWMLAAWNGATFYIEVFSVRYQLNLKEYEKHWDDL